LHLYKGRLARRIRSDADVRRRVARLRHEYELSQKLIATVFQLSTLEERFEILATIGIRDSEFFDVRRLILRLLTLDLKPWEDTLLRMTEAHRHWA
jgi:hypothetical protein